MLKIFTEERNIQKERIFKIYKELEDSFRVSEKSLVVIRIHSTRMRYDKKTQRKSFVWEVANTSGNYEINILSPFAFEKESPHSKKEFIPVITHELTHVFVEKYTKNKELPRWLDEGLAMYMAKNYARKLKQKEVNVGFCKKLATPNGWYKRVDDISYPVSLAFVSFLIKKFSFEKIKDLMRSLGRKYSYTDFKKVFLKIYGKNLMETEEMFISGLDKE